MQPATSFLNFRKDKGELPSLQVEATLENKSTGHLSLPAWK
jgi:hypothetical protein